MKVGCCLQVNQVEFNGECLQVEIEDYGLDYLLLQIDIDNVLNNMSFEVFMIEMLVGLILLDCEICVFCMVFDLVMYKGNVENVVVIDCFDNLNSDLLEFLFDVFDCLIMCLNVVVFGQLEWCVLCMYLVIVKVVYGNVGDKGVVMCEQVVELLEIDQILVGCVCVNLLKLGQQVKIVLVWSGGMLLLYQDIVVVKVVGVVDGVNVMFGFMVEYGMCIVGVQFDDCIGLCGGCCVCVGEFVKEIVCVLELGFFLKDVIMLV